MFYSQIRNVIIYHLTKECCLTHSRVSLCRVGRCTLYRGLWKAESECRGPLRGEWVMEVKIVAFVCIEDTHPGLGEVNSTLVQSTRETVYRV